MWAVGRLCCVSCMSFLLALLNRGGCLCYSSFGVVRCGEGEVGADDLLRKTSCARLDRWEESYSYSFSDLFLLRCGEHRLT